MFIFGRADWSVGESQRLWRLGDVAGVCASFALLLAAAPVARASCFSRTGPLVTVGGGRTSEYDDRSLGPSTKIDATNATWDGGGSLHTLVSFGGDSGACWHGGEIQGGYPLDAPWHTTHPSHGVRVYGLDAVVEDARIYSIGDGISFYPPTDDFVIRRVYMHDIRDDCVEGDYLPGGLIEDSLLDGCYVTFAAVPRSSDSISDGSTKTWKIRNTLAYLRDQIGVYRGTSPGHGKFFKWPSANGGDNPDRGPKISIRDSIFRVDSTVGDSQEQFWIPTDSNGNSKLVSCSNNILVWGGSGPVPAELTAWPSCFTITTDISVWNDAVEAWKIAHGLGETRASPPGDGGIPGSPPPVVEDLRRSNGL